jgi:GNAT superfamily N-acetyltransferase
LREQAVSLAFSTYRANRLLFLGVDEQPEPSLKLHERLFDRPMGLFFAGESIWMAARCQLWRLDNLLAPGQLHEGGDRLYVPAVSYTTGDVNAHELVLGPDGQHSPEIGVTFEPILARLGWSSPRTDFVLLEGQSPQLAAIDWADRHPIAAPYRLLPWPELSQAQQAQAGHLDAPPELQPPVDPRDLEPSICLALLHHEALVGWLIAHRTGAKSVRYSSLFVTPAHRGRARALALLSEGFRRQHAAAIPTARAAIDRRNTAMLRLLKRHLGAHLSGIGRSRFSQAPPPPAPPPPRARRQQPRC